MEFSLPLVIACIIIFLALIVFPLVIFTNPKKKKILMNGKKLKIMAIKLMTKPEKNINKCHAKISSLYCFVNFFLI